MGKSMIVCVDDEQVVLNALNTQLKRKFGDQYHYEFAESGEEAIDIIEEMKEEGYAPVMVISDHIMPGMKGDELLTEVHRRYPKAIKVMLTGQANLDSAVKAINEADLYRYLLKPWDEGDFLLTIEQGMKKYALEVMLGELVEALQMREDLANTIVHDIRTPLNLIQGYSQLILMQDDVPPEYSAYLEEVQKQTERLSGFTNDLLMLAKMENNKLEINRTDIDIDKFIGKIGETHQVLAQKYGVAFAVELPDAGRVVAADATLLQRLLDNLLTNAFKFSPEEGKVTLRVEYPVECKLRLKISDEGPGIPPEHRSRLFDKFQIVDMKKKGVSQIGLGLAFCKTVVDAHGGKIRVESNEPKGSVFVVEM